MSNFQRKIFGPVALVLGSAFSAVQLVDGILTRSISNPLLPRAASTIDLADQPVRFWLMAISFAVMSIALAVGAYRVASQKPAA